MVFIKTAKENDKAPQIKFPDELRHYSDKLKVLDGEETVVSEPNIRAALLNNVIVMLDQCHGIGKNSMPTGAEKELEQAINAVSASVDERKGVVSVIQTFCEHHKSSIMEVYLLADRLKIPLLSKAAAKQISSIVSDNKNTEEINASLNIHNDLSVEEREQIEREIQWCDER